MTTLPAQPKTIIPDCKPGYGDTVRHGHSFGDGFVGPSGGHCGIFFSGKIDGKDRVGGDKHYPLIHSHSAGG